MLLSSAFRLFAREPEAHYSVQLIAGTMQKLFGSKNRSMRSWFFSYYPDY